MDANSAIKEDDNQNSPSVLKLKAIELENKLLIEKQRYILLQSELESAMSIASKHLDLYKNECTNLKEKLTALENDNKVLREKEQKNQETIHLLKKTERADKDYGSESQKKRKYLKKNDNEVKEEVEVYDNTVMEKEGKNTRVFVNLDSDSDCGMKHSPELESEDSLNVINGECNTPRKKLKSSSDSILCYDGYQVSNKDNHSQTGNSHTQSPGNTSAESARRKYKGRIPTSEQKHHALERAEQLQRNIRNPSCVRPMNLSYVSGTYWFTFMRKFCTDNHFPHHDTKMILECEDGVKYAVNYLGKRNAFSGGWVNFARALRLEIGDVLVFELTGSARFKVHIIKAIQEI